MYSFVIPTYNRAHCILNTINSILSQNYEDYEIVIVDDGSTDSTQTLIENMINTGKLFYFKLESNKGANFAKNYGANKSRGEYLIFLDSDDTLVDSFSLMRINSELFSNNKPKLAMFACKDLSNNATISNTGFKGIVGFKDYFIGKFKGEYLPVVNRSFFLSVEFYTDIIGGEGLTWTLLTKMTNQIYISNTIVRVYDNLGIDRLSIKNKRNLLRIRNVFIKDLKINFRDYCRTYHFGLFLVTSKIIYYHLKALRQTK